jgi:hypothetical protein
MLSIGFTAPLPAVAASHKHKTSASKKVSTKTKAQSQRGIDDGRATEIQTALIKAGYLSGEPSGHWDASSQNAMQKLQGDNGWQTKLVPDSRALIKLGLGPTHNTISTTASTASVDLADN